MTSMESGQTGRPEGLWKDGMSPRLLCRFGCNCRAKQNCLWVHKPEVQQWFDDEQALLRRRITMECLFCARGECKYGERCMRSRRAREMRTLRLDSDYESGSEVNSGGGDGGSVSSEGGDVNDAGDESPASYTVDEEAWQQVRDGAVALQQDTSPAGLLRRAILEEREVLCDGRYEVLRLGVDDDDDDEAVGAGAEVDTPGFSFSRREYGLAGQPRDVEGGTPAQARVEDELAAYYFSVEAVESRGRAAEWAAGGWQQPADWGSCLDWIADQWGGTEDTASPRTQNLLIRLQFSSRTGLVGVLLWQQRQRSCTSAVRQWQDWCSEQVAARRAAGGWARVWERFGQLTWHRSSSNNGYRALQKKRGRKGKKRGGTGPVWVVQLVGVLLGMGVQRMGQGVRAAVVAAGAGGSSSSTMSGDGGSESQGDLAETAMGKEETAVSANGEQTAGVKQAVAAAEAEAAADAARRMKGEVAAPPGVSMAESAVTEVRKADAVAAAAATADVEMEEAAVPAGAAAEDEAGVEGMTDYQWVQQQMVELKWKRQQKEGAAAVD